MLRSKYFWIVMVILVPFVVVWVMYGLAWAVGMLVAIGVLFLFVLGGRRSRPTGYDEESSYDEGGREDIYIHRRTVRCEDCGGTGRVPSLYIPRASVKCRTCDGTGRLYD